MLALAVTGIGAPIARASDVVPGEVVVRYAGATHPKVLRVHDPARAIDALRKRPGVVYAVRNVTARASGFVPNDPGRGTTPTEWQAVQWNFSGPWGINMPDAWQNLINAGHPGGRGVTVAVLDTGVAYRRRGKFLQSPDLVPSNFVRGYDYVSDDPYPNDRNGHGTHVASTIAEATNNGIGLTGIAYGVRIMPVRVLDDRGEGDATEIGRGIRFAADHGAAIINLSLEFSVDVTAREIPQLLDAIDYAHRKGSVVVGASGNEAYPVVAYPAKATAVISVGSTTEHGCLSDFSNIGNGLDVVAPGGGADAPLDGEPNCRPDEPSGRDISQVTLEGKDRRRFGIPGKYEGTSMAAPHVAAVAALVIASGVIGKHPSASAIERQLKRTARDLGPSGYDKRYGWGLIDAAAATAPKVAPAPAPAPQPPGTTTPPPAG